MCVANDGLAALTAIEGFVPDIAVVDIGLPGIDGVEIATRLRRRMPQLTMIAVTGAAGPELRERLRGAGFHGYLLKPTPIRDLLALVATAGVRSDHIGL